MVSRIKPTYSTVNDGGRRGEFMRVTKMIMEFAGLMPMYLVDPAFFILCLLQFNFLLTISDA